jgi:hypothetical protein
MWKSGYIKPALTPRVSGIVVVGARLATSTIVERYVIPQQLNDRVELLVLLI